MCVCVVQFERRDARCVHAVVGFLGDDAGVARAEVWRLSAEGRGTTVKAASLRLGPMWIFTGSGTVRENFLATDSMDVHTTWAMALALRASTSKTHSSCTVSTS